MPEYTELSEYNLLLALASSDASSSFTAKAPTTTQPTTNVITPPTVGAKTPNLLQLVFFGAGNADVTYDYRIYGYSKVSTLWVPQLLVGGSATLSATTGVASAAVTNSYKFVDTLDIDLGNSNVSAEVVSPANDEVASLTLDMRGHSLIQVAFDMTGATSANALYRFVA